MLRSYMYRLPKKKKKTVIIFFKNTFLNHLYTHLKPA